MSRRGARQDYKAKQPPAVTVDAEVWNTALDEINDLRQLVADLYDPNDCALVDGVCTEHNEWDPAEEGGRPCPHRRARTWLARWRG